MNTKVKASEAADELFQPGVITDTVVSSGLVHGCFKVGDQWFEVKIQPVSDEDVDAFWPNARDGEQ